MAQQNAHSFDIIPSPNSHEIQVPNDIHAWLAHMESKVVRAHHRCIPRVPSILRNRESNKNCFDPVLVSLGPYHHGKPHLKRMEKYKFDALKHFTSDNNLSGKAADFYKQLEEVALQAKEWYEKPAGFSDEYFKKMMFLDSCFILNVITEYEASQIPNAACNNDSMPLLNTHDEVLVLRDMMMLENQIPFIVLNKLFSIKHGHDICHSKLLHSFVDSVVGISSDDVINSSQDNSCCEIQIEPVHLLDLFRKKILGPDKGPFPKQPHGSSSRVFSETVTELKEAGIICRKGDKMQLKEIGFKKSLLHMVLLLPPIVIDDNRKYLFLNMIAYETGPGGPPDYGIISYICFMDALIDRVEDVKELRKHRVIENALGTDKELADFFNRLSTDLISDSDAYADVKGEIERHSKSPWVKFRLSLLELYQTYFSSPWSTIGLLAGIFLLILAAIQTYFTVYPSGKEEDVVSPPKP